ncbi:B-cell receptor CD22-like [Salvelinus alpinus]|uniref:B-cell receptor CD22-like n=1 Tax=Salvelinus alpinus TaxID=8036 RepID=UPI0039FB894A
MRTMSPDYDTLASVHPDPNSDTYTPLNMKTRSPEYDTLAGVELESTRLVIRYPDRWMQRTPPSPQRTNSIGLNTSSAPSTLPHVVLGQDGWSVTYTPQSICALKGSTVDLTCSYTYPSGLQVKVTGGHQDKTLTCITTCTLTDNPTYICWHNVTEVSWFNKWESGVTKDLRQDSEYADRVEYHRQTEKDYTLRITDLRESVSTEGVCGFIHIVSGLQVEVTSAAEGQTTLTCSTTCTLTDNPTYTWYKNGQRLDEPTSQQYSSNTLVVLGHSVDSYSCTVEHHEDLHSPAVYAPKNTTVSVSPSGEIVEGSSVTLTCSSDANPPVDKYTWYKKNVTSPKASEQRYSITNISSEDRGEYYCEAENKYGRLNSSSVSVDVQYGPKNTSVSVSPSGEIVEGSSVTLTCSSDANPPVDKYTWYKKNVTSPKASGQSYSITNISSEDRGEYYCEAQNGRGSMNSTTLMIIVAGKQTSVVTAAVGIIVVVLVLILCLSGLMWFR